jgi:allene oxide cyclase
MGASTQHRRPSRRTARVIVLIAVTACVALGVSALSSAQGRRGTGGPRSAWPTVHVIEHAVTDTTVNSGGPGDVTGNVLTFHNKVLDPSDAKQVGTDQGYCMRISPADGSWECNWTTFLAHGQITVEGPFYDTRSSVLAITGGTGAYRSAHGEMNLNALHGGTEYDFIFHLS